MLDVIHVDSNKVLIGMDSKSFDIIILAHKRVRTLTHECAPTTHIHTRAHAHNDPIIMQAVENP